MITYQNLLRQCSFPSLLETHCMSNCRTSNRTVACRMERTRHPLRIWREKSLVWATWRNRHVRLSLCCLIGRDSRQMTCLHQHYKQKYNNVHETKVAWCIHCQCKCEVSTSFVFASTNTFNYYKGRWLRLRELNRLKMVANV